jgi:hypothetical protein
MVPPSPDAAPVPPNGATKRCPSCERSVRADLSICPHCRYRFGWDDLEKRQQPVRRPRPLVRQSLLTLLAIVGLLALDQIFNTSTPATDPRAIEPAPLTADQVADCRRSLDRATRAGLIRTRPANNRANVEDLAWAILPADEKHGILAALACDAYEGRPLETMDYVVAYGYRSGRRVAMLTSVGATFN